MKIYTDLVKNKKYSCSIQDDLLKHSQEYRVLATLRYLQPGQYETMTSGESPDLQDRINSVGIEVTAAVRENDMKVSRAFSRFCEASNSRDANKCKSKVESSGYSFVQIQDKKSAIVTTGTSNGEKIFFQRSLRKKKSKLPQYKNNFKILGLAIILAEIPTSEAEDHLIDWIHEVFQEDGNFFDFIYVLSHRFCIYYEPQTGNAQKWPIPKEEGRLIQIIARMTAEGELSIEGQEWQREIV